MPERRIYLVRHAIAEDRSSTGRDADRVLTPEGRKKMKRAARGLAALEVSVDVIFTSPLARARQTAEVLEGALSAAKTEICDELAPGAHGRELSRFLERRAPTATVMLVGHEPDLGEVLAEWLTGRSTGFATRFRKGAVACLLAGMLPPEGAATLEWLMTADQLGRTARD